MITINDLNLSIDFWQWLCGLTEDYFYSEEGIREKEFNRLVSMNIKEIYYESKRAAESIIYQAIDNINDKGDYEINQYKKKIHIFEKDYYKSEWIIFGKYENKTTARIAVLKWIWEQVNKKESLCL